MFEKLESIVQQGFLKIHKYWFGVDVLGSFSILLGGIGVVILLSAALWDMFSSNGTEIETKKMMPPASQSLSCMLDQQKIKSWCWIVDDTLIIPLDICRVVGWSPGKQVQIVPFNAGLCSIQLVSDDWFFPTTKSLVVESPEGLKVPLLLLNACWTEVTTKTPNRIPGSMVYLLIRQDYLTLLPPVENSYIGGTDMEGQSVLRRVLKGTTIYLWLCIGVVPIGLVLGGFLGISAGYSSNRFIRLFSTLLMNSVEACPRLILVLIVGYLIGLELFPIMLTLGVTMAPRVARAVYSKVILLKTSDFIEAARELGLTESKIVRRHIIYYNCLPILFVQGFLGIGDTVLFESTVSYLVKATAGVSLVMDGYFSRSWGTMLAINRGGFLEGAYWTVLPPLAAIVLTILTFYHLADGFNRLFRIHSHDYF